MIRFFYIIVFLSCQLLGSNKTEAYVTFEYWLSEDFKLFSSESSFLLKIKDDTINVSPNNWIGEIMLEEKIEIDSQTFSLNNIFNQILVEKSIPKEDLWIDDYFLLDDKEIKVRYLLSKEEDDIKLFRMDIKPLNKDGDDNKINNVILNHDLIKVWTNLDNEIKKVSLMYNNAFYTIELNEE